MPGACFCGALLAFCGDCMAGSPLIIKDLDLYPQPPTNTRLLTLNSEEPDYSEQPSQNKRSEKPRPLQKSQLQSCAPFAESAKGALCAPSPALQ